MTPQREPILYKGPAPYREDQLEHAQVLRDWNQPLDLEIIETEHKREETHDRSADA